MIARNMMLFMEAGVYDSVFSPGKEMNAVLARYYMLAVCIALLPTVIVLDIFGWQAAAFAFFSSIIVLWAVWTVLVARLNRSRAKKRVDANLFL